MRSFFHSRTSRLKRLFPYFLVLLVLFITTLSIHLVRKATATEQLRKSGMLTPYRVRSSLLKQTLKLTGNHWYYVFFGADWIDLAGPTVNDEHLSCLNYYPEMTWLTLAHTQVTPEGLSHLDRFKHLKVLHLGGENINDECISSLTLVKSIEVLHIADTSISNKSLEIICNHFPNLKELQIRSAISESKINKFRLCRPDVDVSYLPESPWKQLYEAGVLTDDF